MPTGGGLLRGERIDFIDLQRSLLENTDFSEEDLRAEVRKLRILQFDLDNKGKNIVSLHEGCIVFIDPKYNGEQVNRGDIWLCSIRSVSTVYNAIPLRKITASILMGMDDSLRHDIIDALWKTNRRAFEDIFREKYSSEVYNRARNEAREQYEAQLREKDVRISELEKEVSQGRYMLSMRASSDQQDGIQLRSDDVVATASIDQPAPVTVPVSTSVQSETAPTFQWSNNYVAPGIPEMRYWEEHAQTRRNYRFNIERVSPETLKCEGFPDGKYFVHISPKKNILVIRKHDYGSALCIDGRMRLDGLGELVPFKEREKLVAEYNQKYDGVLIHL